MSIISISDTPNNLHQAQNIFKTCWAAAAGMYLSGQLATQRTTHL